MPDKLTRLHFAGSDWMLSADELGPDFRADLLACCPPGIDADPNIDALLARWPITGEPEDCRQYLDGYGAWDETELSDHNANLKRLVWLTAGSLNDGEDACFPPTEQEQ